MKTLGRVLAGVGLLVLAVPFVLLTIIFAQLLPLPSVLIAGALVGAVALWLFLRKRSGGIHSEAGLMGRQTSKEGLL